MNKDLIETLSSNLAPAKRIHRPVGMAYVLICLVLTIAVTTSLFGVYRESLILEAPVIYYVSQAAFLALGLSAAYSTISMATPQVGRRSGPVAALLMAVASLPLSALLSYLLQKDPDPFSHHHHMSCVVTGLAFGGLVGAALLFWLRRGAPVSLHRAGLHLGVAVGALGTFVSALSCPITSLEHIGLAHAVPVFLGGLLGYLLVPKLITW
jgi:hypothetical protein